MGIYMYWSINNINLLKLKTMKIQKTFGIKSININGTAINTVNVRVNNTSFNSNVLSDLRKLDSKLCITNVTVPNFRKQTTSERIEISYTGMDYYHDLSIIKAIGKKLKIIKLNNIDDKYNWCSDNTNFDL